jgi:protocatechuate 3,4-dioxygenase alpha subunit
LDIPGLIAIEGRVFDQHGKPVPDAMLEFWSAATEAASSSTEAAAGIPAGFRRAVTGYDGFFSVIIERPATVGPGDDRQASPHFMVMVFARGLLRQLLTCVYLGDGSGKETDPVLSRITEERRVTLIATADHQRVNVFHWDVRLQGAGETVFFAW